MEQGDATDGGPERVQARSLKRPCAGRASRRSTAEEGSCELRHGATNSITQANPHRPFSAEEVNKRDGLTRYLDRWSEDALIEEVLLPLFRQLGFQRITAAGHKDKALEYGKDVWMRYALPTQHVIYFGIQAKKGKLDAAG